MAWLTDLLQVWLRYTNVVMGESHSLRDGTRRLQSLKHGQARAIQDMSLKTRPSMDGGFEILFSSLGDYRARSSKPPTHI